MWVQAEVFLQTLVAGILLGGLYALIGIGMTLILGVMKIINLTHGQLMMVAMYIAFWLFTLFGIDPYVSLLIAPPLMFAFGMLIQKALVNPVLRVESILPHNQVILTVGIGLVLQNAATILFTSDYRSTPVDYASTAFYLSDLWQGTPVEISLSLPWTVSFLLSVVITVLLWFFLAHTDTGKSIRATAQDKDAAMIMGVNVGLMRVITFGLGSALVACAGCLFIPIYYLFPALGSQFTLIAFVITILGGLGSTLGAILGGLILGVFESMTATYVGMGWAPVGRFVIFVAALVFLPGGVASLLKTRKLSK
ncbi:branched-chain amino acid ABC transporter permease [Nitratidesulfovibrio sp. HK-II]|jgi:branched-chain amino acid transport system permease protein|uniref:branched-chain amino acid ABC transporter permease n=1 Tax=Nitratidesulfovibrio sp. HK-II TaxID=2009266 RepID=UPI00022757CA|nr:branched-chain amino acid ABC transporter permease [Nitratidesulfovibrio sp. HK-II]EGY25929.1 branched-chain amino acid transport system / permease component family protein [Desulfovibrio sp. A2]GBO97910.1 high-affinity branched-chain amino acid transport system permease protein LivH [Nitratidesulfovibrio sp. HK-II]HCG03983.1 branched-chain amino acid ABC transporter permease [Desulfovibrio sp.]